MEGPAMLNISNVDIFEAYYKHGTQAKAADALGISEQLVGRAMTGKRRSFVVKGAKASRHRICTCCKSAPVMKGNWFLCRNCYQSNGDECEEYKVHATFKIYEEGVMDSEVEED
jgi:hypothetical protein